MNYKAPRGTHDIFGEQAKNIQELEKTARRVLSVYNYSEIRFPTFEDAALFSRSIGDTTDIVEKEMYVFQDRKGRSLALRPEGTASAVRAYLENSLHMNMAVGKLYYMGPMFRYERPQAGRYREFFQIGAEYLGNADPAADAEIIIAASRILQEFGISQARIHANSLGCQECRPSFRKALMDYLAGQAAAEGELCRDCKGRVQKNPLRVLDCKIDSAKLSGLPKMEDFLCENCKLHFNEVKELLCASGIDFTVDHKLVRGLDYYTRTVFEIRSSSVGSQDAILAGGRYDNLVAQLGGPKTPAVGFALGTERVVMARDNQSPGAAGAKRPVVFIAVSSENLGKEAFIFAQKLRSAHINEDVIVEGPFRHKSLKSQMRLADRTGAAKVIIFGGEEWSRQSAMVRDMKSQSQKETKLEELLTADLLFNI